MFGKKMCLTWGILQVAYKKKPSPRFSLVRIIYSSLLNPPPKQTLRVVLLCIFN